MKLLLVAGCVFVSVELSGQKLSCAPGLDSLTYPALALATRIQGTVSMTFTVGADGKATDIDSAAYPLLRIAVEEALRLVKVAAKCAGQRVAIQVNFELSTSAPKQPPFTERISEEVWHVLAPAPTIEVAISDPGWIFSRKGRFVHRVRVWLSRL